MVRLVALSLLIACLLLPLGTSAQKAATIAGNVYYGNDYNPAQNVAVSLYDNERVLLETQTTLDGGQFRFGGVKRSTYILNIDVPGYEPVSLDVDVSMASDKILAIYLKPSSKKKTVSSGKIVSVHELSMPEKARTYMESGEKKLYEQKDAQAALEDFQQAVSVAPTYYEAHYQVGMAQLTLGHRAEAEIGFRKAVELSGDKYPEADVGLGAALLDDGKISEADKSIRRGLQLNPNLWLAHYELGRELLKQNQLVGAQDAAEEARLLAPSAPIVYRLLSNIHLQEKNYPALLEDLNRYIALDPDSPAGIRAKQVRDQVQQEVGTGQVAPASTKP
ncbi:MAG: tetratricopeptide repeat protein [Candidatus Acidiferrum sp.]